MKNRDLANLLNRCLAFIEEAAHSSDGEQASLVEDLEAAIAEIPTGIEE